MGQIVVQGSVTAGPPNIVQSSFPQAQMIANLATLPNPKPYSVASGVLTRRLATIPPAFDVLRGIGAGDAVTTCDTLYFRSDAQVTLRLTQQDPLNPGVPFVRILVVSGLFLCEFPPGSYLLLLEAQGACTIEYLATGPQ